MSRFEVHYCRHERGWVVYEDGDQITPGFSCESSADVWLDEHIKREEKEIEEIILGGETNRD